ncbi:MAG: PhoH family protein, partial [Candidatus Methylomirabilales bacterium]
MQGTTQVKILVPGDHDLVNLFGTRDELLKLIERGFDTSILVRGNEITVTGEPKEAQRTVRVFEELIELLRRGHVLTADAVGRSIDMVREGTGRPSEVLSDAVLVTRSKWIRPKTLGQKRYVDAIRKDTIIFAIGPAGTGKTYLAVASAVHALQQKSVQRIILTRPAVEAGEKLGFLPGDLAAKIDPYLKPLYDALYEMLEPEAFSRAMERGEIEVAPLAFMRGRTLNDSFIILDEAQNT